jgi:hypothetical protein
VLKTLVRRFGLGCGLATLGLLWCVGNDYYWQEKVLFWTPSFYADVVIAFPFYVLGAAAILGWPRFIGAALTTIALGLFASWAYWAAATSSSSTAGLAFFLPLFYGTILVALAVLLQVLVDALRSRRTREFVGQLSESDQADWARFISGSSEQ